MNKLLVYMLISTIVSYSSIAQSSDENNVWQQIELLNRAVFDTKDSIVITTLVSKDLSYGHSGGNIEDKTQMVHNAATSPTIYKNSSTEKISIDFIKNTAVARHLFRATSIEKGVESPLSLSVMQVWVKQKGKWVLLARQSVKVNPK